MNEAPRSSLPRQLILFSSIRAVINTGFRMVYPFLPTLSRALGVSIQSIALAITARSVLGLLGPVLGSAGDILGRRRTMVIGILIFSSGFLLVGVWPTFTSLVIALLLGAAGKILFDPAMQAYLGDSVSYLQRGKVIAVTEFGWSGAALVGLPVTGWLIARFGWRAPFPILGVLGLLAMILLQRTIPALMTQRPAGITFFGTLKSIALEPSAMAALSVAFLLSTGNEVVNIVYGVWLEGSFGLQVAAVGAASAVIGLAELAGEGVVFGWTDRWGKRRAVGAGVCVIAFSCLLLPFTGGSLAGALLGLFLFYIAFEFTFVSLISMVSEITPHARATLLAGNLTASAGGRALGAFIGPLLYPHGLIVNGALAALTALVSLFLLIRSIKVE
jgi:predicted MFS family arabinose efflux permease